MHVDFNKIISSGMSARIRNRILRGVNTIITFIGLKKDYHFTPLAFETIGLMGSDTRIFLNKLGKLIKKETSEKRSLDFLMQKLSTAIQRGNASCVLGTGNLQEKVDR